MRFTEDYEEEKNINHTWIRMTCLMSVVILGIVVMVIMQNKTKLSDGSGYQKALQQAGMKEEEPKAGNQIEELVSGSTLTSDQLDFWNLSTVIKENDQAVNSKNGVVTNQTTGEQMGIYQSKEEQEALKKDGQLQDENGLDTEEVGDYEQIQLDNGQVKQIEIHKEWKLGTGNSNFQQKDGRMQYLINGKDNSTTGVYLSRTQGTVNFKRLKNANIDFVMIQVGQRGYSSGNIVLDPNYENLLKEANQYQMPAGVIFQSQATNMNEVYEELEELISAIDDYKIDYPVVVSLENIVDDLARTDGLEVETRTKLMCKFLEEIKAYGYTPALQANKEWLLTKLDLSLLQDFDIWLTNNADTPEFPYEMAFWQYDDEIEISGIENATKISICIKNMQNAK